MQAIPARTRLGTISLCLVLASLASTSASAQIATEPDTAQVLAVARRWLALLDGGHYAESLDSAAPLLRQMAGTTNAWREFVGQARSAFPPSPSRALVGLEPAPDVTGAPAGHYLRITFRVDANHAVVYEVVVLQETVQGWRIAMYGTRGG
jgi:Protein of unknown function (DUF4019)